MEVDINEIEEQEPEISADKPEKSTFVSQVMQDVDRLAAREEPAEYDRTNYLAPYEPVIPEGAKAKFAANVQANPHAERNRAAHGIRWCACK